MSASSRDPELSIVVPVYNGAESIGKVVRRIHEACSALSHEIVLVDDGSRDQSAAECRRLVERAGRESVRFVQLSRNFGEHNAVLAGLRQTCGRYVAVLDDDGQNPPEEVPRMLEALQASHYDVIYGRYRGRKHSFFRRLGSQFNDRVANWMLNKPRGLYLSSFKVMNRFIVHELAKSKVPFPYIDGIICRTTTRLGQIEVQHDERLAGKSNYTLKKLVALWLNMFLGFTIWPLRLSVIVGLMASATSILWLIAILIDKLFISPDMTAGIPTVLACIVLFAGVQLCVLGTIGEYVGRLFLDVSGTPQSIVREIVQSQGSTDATSHADCSSRAASLAGSCGEVGHDE